MNDPNRYVGNASDGWVEWIDSFCINSVCDRNLPEDRDKLILKIREIVALLKAGAQVHRATYITVNGQRYCIQETGRKQAEG